MTLLPTAILVLQLPHYNNHGNRLLLRPNPYPRISAVLGPIDLFEHQASQVEYKISPYEGFLMGPVTVNPWGPSQAWHLPVINFSNHLIWKRGAIIYIHIRAWFHHPVSLNHIITTEISYIWEIWGRVYQDQFKSTDIWPLWTTSTMSIGSTVLTETMNFALRGSHGRTNSMIVFRVTINDYTHCSHCVQSLGKVVI